jgi:hypothetical protein
VTGDYESLHKFRRQAMWHLWKNLNRCSRKERFNWEGFKTENC